MGTMIHDLYQYIIVILLKINLLTYLISLEVNSVVLGNPKNTTLCLKFKKIILQSLTTGIISSKIFMFVQNMVLIT